MIRYVIRRLIGVVVVVAFGLIQSKQQAASQQATA